LLLKLSPKLPSPLPVAAVTVYVAPLPLKPVTETPVSPVPTTRAKLLWATFVTDSLNVTVQETLEAFVGDDPARVIDDTVGAVVSIVQVTLVALLCVPLLSTALSWNVCDPAAKPVKLTEPLVVVAFAALVTGQVFATPSSVHAKVTFACASL
jgi:hypothetical protein